MNPTLMVPLLLLALLGIPLKATAHGAKITYQQTQAIAIQASYDSGEPMRQAQVVVYAPDNPAQPWTQGTTDGAGQFTFTPDASKPGNWEVKVRQAGHGDIATIPIGAATGTAMTPTNTSGSSLDLTRGTDTLTPIQKGLMGGAIVWGCIGTALFFARGKQSRAHS